MIDLTPKVLLIASLVVVGVALVLYLLIKKEKYSGAKSPQSAVVSLSQDAQAVFATQQGKQQFNTAIASLEKVLMGIQIGVVGPSQFIPSGYEGAVVVFYNDGTRHVHPFGKTLASVGNDLLQMYKRVEHDE